MNVDPIESTIAHTFNYCSLHSSTFQNVVVATQPTSMPPVAYVEPRLKSKPTVMIVTIVLTAVCLVQQCWPVLVCMVPGLIAAVVVSWLLHQCWACMTVFQDSP